MSFNLKETTWRIDVWRGGVEPYWFWVTGNKREALKDATETFRGLKQKGLRQKGSLYRDRFTDDDTLLFAEDGTIHYV